VFLAGNSPWLYTRQSYTGKVCGTVQVGKPTVSGQRLTVTPQGNEPVWCIRTPVETWVMRQGDQIALTGNTGYGGGAKAISRVTHWPTEQSKEFLHKLKAGYPMTERKRGLAARELLRVGYVQNRLGRRRRFPTYAELYRVNADRNHPDSGKAWTQKSTMERQAYNFWLQSLGSDFLSLSTIQLVLFDEQLARWGVKFCLSLHDALYAYSPKQYTERAARRIQEIMEGIVRTAWNPSVHDWTLPVDVSWGSRWGAADGGSLKD
jgi:DNA polymerase I-like protein with 3'-5' exonuclease and polymerase domains